jgi:hypothetical protein
MVAVGVFDVYGGFFNDLVEPRSSEPHLQRHNFGEHELGKSSICVRDGLIPVKFETFRKTLCTFGTIDPSLLGC